MSFNINCLCLRNQRDQLENLPFTDSIATYKEKENMREHTSALADTANIYRKEY
jgi:hypothetical protein